MKTALTTLFALAAAPAFAHADGSFHTHGAELFLALITIAAIAAWMRFSSK
jgi:hypothetical protein